MNLLLFAFVVAILAAGIWLWLDGRPPLRDHRRDRS